MLYIDIPFKILSQTNNSYVFNNNSTTEKNNDNSSNKRKELSASHASTETALEAIDGISGGK